MASITGNINDLMVSEKGSLRNIIANLNSLSQTLKSKEGQIGHILTNVDKFTDSLSRSQFPTAIAEMTVTLNRLNTTLDKVNNGEGTVGKFVNDQALYDSLVDASANLSALLYDIKAHPKRYINISVFGGGRLPGLRIPYDLPRKFRIQNRLRPHPQPDCSAVYH